MGLDVYLYKYENKDETDQLEEKYEAFSNSQWEAAGKYNSLNEEQISRVRAENKSYATSIGLDESVSDPRKEKIEIDSAIDKDHYFKIGYFRSSYNEGGINRVLSNLGVADLYDIFSPDDQYCFQPDWNDALTKCNESIKALESKPDFRCIRVDQNLFRPAQCSSEKEALEIFMTEWEKRDTTSFDHYSNSEGQFSLKEPLKIYGIIPGVSRILGEHSASYLIAEGENAWYVTALKIVRETIEYVLSQEDPSKYYLHWSS